MFLAPPPHLRTPLAKQDPSKIQEKCDLDPLRNTLLLALTSPSVPVFHGFLVQAWNSADFHVVQARKSLDLLGFFYAQTKCAVNTL